MSRESHASMTVIEVPQGSTGTTLVLTFKRDGVAQDLSSASGSKIYNAMTVGGSAVVTGGSVSWTTNGTDGKVSIPMVAALVGTVRDLLMDVEIQEYGSGNLVSRRFILRTTPRAIGV